VHSWKLACDGANRPQPIKIPVNMPMRSSPMQFPPRVQSSARILAAT
jgi:hypothetical protein